MSSFFIANGESKTVPGVEDKSMMIFNWRFEHQKGLDTLEDSAHALWERNQPTKEGKYKEDEAETVFDNLTRSEKLGIVELHLKRVQLDLAESYNINSQADTARDTAVVENETKYDLED